MRVAVASASECNLVLAPPPYNLSMLASSCPKNPFSRYISNKQICCRRMRGCFCAPGLPQAMLISGLPTRLSAFQYQRRITEI